MMAKRAKAAGSGDGNGGNDKSLSPATISRILTTANPGELPRSVIRLAMYNPRQISDSAFRRLCDSIRKFGLVQRPLINRRTGNTVVGGHQRIKAADKVFGTTDYNLPVDLIDVDELTERALNVALNNPELQGQYDIDLLGEVVASISEAGGDIRDTGFSLTDLKTFMSDEFIATVFGGGGGADGGGDGDGSVGGGNSEAAQSAAESPHVDLLAEIRGAGATGNQPPAGESGPPAGLSVNDDLAAKRDRFKTATRSPTADNADTIVTLVFERSDMVPRFLRDIQMDAAVRFVDGVEVARAIGLPNW